MKKKAQAGLVGGVLALAIAGVVAIIMVGVYNQVYNDDVTIQNETQGGYTCPENATCHPINGSTAAVFSNIPVFIGLLIILAAAGGFALSGRR